MSPLSHLRSALALAFMALGGVVAANSVADEFQSLVDSYGNATTLAGKLQDPTTIDQNHWLPSYEGGFAKDASLSNPHVAAADAFGNVYIADKGSHAILKITPDGRIHTFAGTHVAEFNGDGPAPGTTLSIFSPNGVYVLPDGTVYLLDPGNHRIRRVGPDGIMTTVVNDPDPEWYPSGRALWVRQDEQLIYYTNEYAPATPGSPSQGACVKRWTPAGGIELVCDRTVGFSNPGNLDVNPANGSLYVCDRAEEDTSLVEVGLWLIDKPNSRIRISGNHSQVVAASGQPVLNSYVAEVRGIAFRQDGSYFLCGHRDGNIWFVDTGGILHQYIQGSGKKDTYSVADGVHPPLTGINYLSQPRQVTLGPEGSLYITCNDSGYVLQVKNALPPVLPGDFHPELRDSNGVRLGWTGLKGHSYIVERSASLTFPDWQAIGAKAGTGGLTEYLDASADQSASATEFYRLTPPR